MESYYLESSDPLAEVEDFHTYREAVDRAKEIATELRAEGYEVDASLASRRNMYAFKATKAGSRTITVQINDEE